MPVKILVWHILNMMLVECRKISQTPQLQSQLQCLYSWTLENSMKLNPSKCYSMSFSFSKQLFQPPVFYIDNIALPSLNVVKILGVMIEADLKWNAHVTEIIKKCNKKLFMLRRLKTYNLPVCDLVTVYIGYVRPVLEYCVPLFTAGLTSRQINYLESIQKRACRMFSDQIHFI